MSDNLGKIFNLSLIYATFRASTPIIYAALCAAITQQANILNIGTEGIMLVGAFTAVANRKLDFGGSGSNARRCLNCHDYGGKPH